MAREPIELQKSYRQAPPGARVAGMPAANENVQLTVVVRRRNPLPGPGAIRIRRQHFAATYGAHPDDLERVAKFARDEGLTVVATHPARRSVILSGTVADATRAFGVHLMLYERAGHRFRGRTGTLTVPTDLAHVIQGVFGFDQRPQAKPHFRLMRAAAGKSFTPVQVAQLYQFPKGTTGAGQTIAIIELGGGYRQSDLDSFFSNLGLPTPAVTPIGVDGASNQPEGDPNGADGEVLLDIEVAGAVAPGAAIAVYFAPNTDQGFLNAIATAIHDQATKPDIVSISWGGPESSWTSQSLQSYDQAFQDAAALGVTVCVAAGDDGSTDGEDDGQAHVDFPASSPHVLACGGTTLVAAKGAIQSETVWNDGPGNGATGGGVSETFALPPFQQSAAVPASVNTGFAGRGVPDVAGDADPNSGYQVQVDGQAAVIGGTSAVAPLWAGLIALLNQQLGKSAGFLNSAIYQAPLSAAGFHDVVTGSNGSYNAGPGWDACTGWGSPNGAALLKGLS
ncbi:MAG TPA: S53 family peptidase [Bryobacteraceae bacterium]|nr:S53 family peptidase [Bryobacteraceae bacterium]